MIIKTVFIVTAVGKESNKMHCQKDYLLRSITIITVLLLLNTVGSHINESHIKEFSHINEF